MSTRKEISAEQQYQINQVLACYGLDKGQLSYEPLGNGLINSTYLISTIGGSSENEAKKWVLQQINQQVFKQPKQVTDNADLISAHLNKKIANNNYQLQAIKQLKNLKGDSLTCISDGETSYWRILTFVENSYSVESLHSPAQAYSLAKAFGDFTLALSDIDTKQLREVITHFHHLLLRLEQLKQAYENAEPERKAQSEAFLTHYQDHQNFIDEVASISAVLPTRLTHNDTKINNLLFDRSNNKATAVIDLDTCMPGFVMNDFGDMVRSCCFNRDESATEVNEISFNVEIFTQLAQGYLASLKPVLTEQEKQSLVLGCLLQPFMLSTRFLADYLNGDSYFATQYAQQNLDRANNQLHAFKCVLAMRNQLNDIINNI